MSLRKLFRLVCLAILLGFVAVLLPTTATTAEAAYCGLHWGSLAKSSGAHRDQEITNVRTGRNTCYDRLVVDLDGSRPTGYHVAYVKQVRQEGSGRVVPLRGGAKLEIVVYAPAYDEDGDATFTPARRSEVRNVDGYRTFRQVAWAGSFEGQTTIGLGVRARLPFRVFTIDDGHTTRLVIDVAHRW